MSTQSPKQTLFGQFAAVAKCLSHPHRLELLEQLAQGERSVEILAQKTGLSTANASQHLRNMLRTGVVTSAREGKFVVYKLADHAVLDLLSSLRTITERNSAVVAQLVRNYFNNLDILWSQLRAKSWCNVCAAAKSWFWMCVPKTSSDWGICRER